MKIEYSGFSIRQVHLACIIICFALSFLFFNTSRAETTGQSNKTEFAIIGDMPYNARQRQQFLNVIQEMNSAELAFVVHAGDYWFDGLAWNEHSKGLPPCSDEVFADRLKMAESLKHSFIITPGDNDWTDCHRAKPRSYDPLERLSKLRKMFFQGDTSLGQRTMKLRRQSKQGKYAKYVENVRWVYADVMFVTLHMVGSNNNLGRTAEMDAEYQKRNEANLDWLDEAFSEAKRNDNKAIMIIAQANPQFENRWTSTQKRRYLLGGLGIKPANEQRETGFDGFLGALEEYVIDFGKPVVYVHGDTHTFRIDKPLIATTSRRMIENFTRVETYGFPDTHWLRVSIDHQDPNIFQFRQEIVEKNLVEH
jgi:predicted phosphodiesterase